MGREADSKKLDILVLTDGKAGDVVQCRGVALSLVREVNGCVREFVLSRYFFWFPYFFCVGVPDIIIASGWRTLLWLRYFRLFGFFGYLFGHPNRPFLVFLKDPRRGYSVPDFLWVPWHDDLTSKKNVLSTLTSPHCVTPDVLGEARPSALERFGSLPSPYAGILLGGNSGSVRWDEESSRVFVDCLSDLPPNETLLVTPSRRTPDCLLSAVRGLSEKRSVWIWDGSGSNPYFEILALSDRLIVTGDSHNMVSECLSVGVPVYVHRPPGLHKKFQRFLDELLSRGLVRFTDNWDSYPSTPHNSTDEIAKAILNVINDDEFPIVIHQVKGE